jgi:hypothetical protein
VPSFRLLVFIRRFDPATGAGRHKDKRGKANALAARAISKDRITRFEHFGPELGGMLSLLVSKLSVHSVKCLAVFFYAEGSICMKAMRGVQRHWLQDGFCVCVVQAPSSSAANSSLESMLS